MKPTFIKKEDQGGENRRTSSQRFLKSSNAKPVAKKQPPIDYDETPPQNKTSLDVRESPLITEPLNTFVKDTITVPIIQEEDHEAMDSVIDEHEQKEMNDRITEAARDREMDNVSN
jgi:hypothetical protein